MAEQAATTGKAKAPPKSKEGREVYVSRRLHSVEGIRQEITRVYRDGRKGRLDTLDAHRLATVLHLAAKLIVGQELEARISALEKHAEVNKWAA